MHHDLGNSYGEWLFRGKAHHQTVCTFTVYVHRQKGEDDAPLRFRTEVWSKQAETCMNLLDKGSRVTVAGTLDEETYENKEGKLVSINVIRFAQVLDYGTKPSATAQEAF